MCSNHRRRKQTACAVICLLTMLLGGCSAADGRASDDAAPALRPIDERFANREEIIAAIRQGLTEKSPATTVTFSDSADVSKELSALVEDWMEEALRETVSAAEGDYIRYQTGGYRYSCSTKEADGLYHYRICIEVDHYATPRQEEAVDEAVRRILDELPAGEEISDAETIRWLYDDICTRVRYDKVHRKHPYNHIDSTAYAALCLESASCQGFCTALYRLLREAGIDCRIVTGTLKGETERHAWLLAELDGMYYLLDPTWDAGVTDGSYRFFLTGTAENADRQYDEVFTKEAFAENYPLAEGSYDGIGKNKPQ